MGARTGTISFRRYRVMDTPPRDFRQPFTKGVRAHALCPLDPRKSKEDRAIGWCSLHDENDLDLSFDTFCLEERIGLSMRVDTIRPPAQEVKRALLERQRAEEQKRKAPLPKAALRGLKEQIIAELRLRTPPQIKTTDMIWNYEHKKLYFFAHAKGPSEAFMDLFGKTFDIELDVEGPGAWAADLAAAEGLEERLDEARPTAELLGGFAGLRPDVRPADPRAGGLSGAEADHGFLGREFLTWLIYHADDENGGGEFSAREAGEGGPFRVQLGERVVLRSEGEGAGEITARGPAPAQTADVRYAIAGGLSVREADLLLLRGDQTFQLLIGADQFDVKRAKLPEVLSKEDGERLAERLALLDELDEMLRAAYFSFLRRRLQPAWAAQHLPHIRAWLARSCLTETASASPQARARAA